MIFMKKVKHINTKNWKIKEQLNLVKKYNFENNKVDFLHPKVDELIGNDKPLDDKMLDLLNDPEHRKDKFLPCAQLVKCTY